MHIKPLLLWVIQALIVFIVADIILSYLIQFGKITFRHPLVRFVQRVVNPILNPIRRILPPPYKTGGFDFSPTVAWLLLWVLGNIITHS